MDELLIILRINNFWITSTAGISPEMGWHDTNLTRNLISVCENIVLSFYISLIADHGYITEERENDISKHNELLDIPCKKYGC